jgi:hypothetical protein
MARGDLVAEGYPGRLQRPQSVIAGARLHHSDRWRQAPLIGRTVTEAVVKILSAGEKQ